MIQFYKKKGIQILETMAYTQPQQYGVAERLNRKIIEKVRALLLQSNTPKNMWSEAVYIINRSPTRALEFNKTPAELWFREKPNISKLRIFECHAYAWVPDQRRGKLDSKSLELVVVIGSMGYE